MLSTNQLSVSRNSKFSVATAVLIICFFVYHYYTLSHITFGISAGGDENPLQQPAHQQPLTSERTPPPPAPPPSRIPKKLWFKLGPKGLNDNTREWTNSCINNNKDYEVNFMTDTSSDVYVHRRFQSSRPDLVEIYHGLNIPILKADMLRYLLLFTEGGVYLDLDVSCDAPIDLWVPQHYKDDASVVVGWEFDMGWGDNFLREFATWTIIAKPASPHIWMVIEDILDRLRNVMKERNVTVGGLTMEMVGDVVDSTGPRRFTRGILKSLEARYNATLKDVQELVKPKLAGDVLVLPGYAFAATSNRYPEGMVVPPPLVTHHFAGSWKNDYGGESS